MKKKSIIKFVCATATALAIPYIYNKYSEYKNFPLENLKSDKNFFITKFGDIAYSTYGNPKGKPLLLLHPFDYGSSSQIFENYLDRFSDYHIYTLDFLGYGLSDKPNISYSFYMYSLIINSFVEEVIGEKVKVIALDDATTSLVKASVLSPQNFEKLILVNPVLDPIATSSITSFFVKLLNNTYLGEFLYNLSFTKILSRSFILKSDSLLESDNRDAMLNSSKTGGKYKSLAFVQNMAKSYGADFLLDIEALKVPTSLVLSDLDIDMFSLDTMLNNPLIDYYEVDDSYKAFLLDHLYIIEKAL